MENDTKSLLMQYLGRFAEHYQIDGHASITFKKRAELLEKLKAKNSEAFVIMEELFSTFLREDRIANDKEKFDKARILWEAERAAAEKEKVTAEMNLVKFCKAHQIQIGSLSISA